MANHGTTQGSDDKRARTKKWKVRLLPRTPIRSKKRLWSKDREKEREKKTTLSKEFESEDIDSSVEKDKGELSGEEEEVTRNCVG